MGSAVSSALLTQSGVFLLALVRVSGIFLVTPFFAGPAIPARVKIGLSFFLAVILIPLLGGRGTEALARLGDPLSLALAAASELAVGFVIGMAGSVVLGAIQTAGHLMSQDIGLTIANVIDPITSIQVSVIGQLKVALALFIFIGLDFHHAALRLLAESFRLIPLGALSERLFQGEGAARLGDLAASQGSTLFEAAVRLGLPLAVTLLLVTVAMGLLARSVPEINVFILGFGIRALVGLWLLCLSVPLLARTFGALFERAAADSARALRALAGS